MTTPKSRGKQSGDDRLFAGKAVAAIREAVEDLSWLLGRGYAERSSLALVGNRYRLNVRQQKAVLGMAASDASVEYRRSHSLSSARLKGTETLVDGFNVLILLESLLSGAYVFEGRDGFYRDLSSVHGSYRKVRQTGGAIDLVTAFFVDREIGRMQWLFDKPVSNSGRLKQLIEGVAAEKGLDWQVELIYDTDKEIVRHNLVTVSSDAWILDRVDQNFNLIAYILEKYPDTGKHIFHLAPHSR